jgi:hypothetical protein
MKLAFLGAQVQEKELTAKMQPSQQQNKPPSTSLSFKDLPPDGQTQLAAQAGIKINAPAQPAPMEGAQAPGQAVPQAPEVGQSVQQVSKQNPTLQTGVQT